MIRSTKRAIGRNLQVSRAKFNLLKVWGLNWALVKFMEDQFQMIVEVRGPIWKPLEVMDQYWRFRLKNTYTNWKKIKFKIGTKVQQYESGGLGLVLLFNV